MVVVVDAWFTVSTRAAEVLELKFASPAYTTVMEWDPTDNPPIVNCAFPPADKLLVASAFEPSTNVTVPVGVPLADGCTAAVKVTDSPIAAGLRLEATVVAVVARVTVCVRGTDMLAEKLLSPLYFAVMAGAPTDQLDSESCAALVDTEAVPKAVVPSRKVTVPVAAPAADGCTVAVKTTA